MFQRGCKMTQSQPDVSLVDWRAVVWILFLFNQLHSQLAQASRSWSRSSYSCQRGGPPRAAGLLWETRSSEVVAAFSLKVCVGLFKWLNTWCVCYWHDQHIITKLHSYKETLGLYSNHIFMVKTSKYNLWSVNTYKLPLKYTWLLSISLSEGCRSFLQVSELTVQTEDSDSWDLENKFLWCSVARPSTCRLLRNLNWPPVLFFAPSSAWAPICHSCCGTTNPSICPGSSPSRLLKPTSTPSLLEMRLYCKSVRADMVACRLCSV